MTVSEFFIAKKLITGKDGLKQLKSEVERLKIKRPLIVTDEILTKIGTVNLVEKELSEVNYQCYTGVKPEPEIALVEECALVVKRGMHDGLIAVGGGSAIDIAKAVAVFITNGGRIEDYFGTNLVAKAGLPLIAIPTTAGTGSEVTNIAILSDKQEQVKKGIVSPYLLPDVALVSPEMTVSMPKSVTAASGIDALVHAIEAYLSVRASPVTDALALYSMKMIAINLPKAFANPNNLEAREAMITASLMAGTSFGNAGVGAVHALAYPLGGRYNLSHGVTNALLLPYVMESNQISCFERFVDIGQALGITTSDLTTEEAAEAAIMKMKRLCAYVEIPTSLKDFGVPEEDIPQLAIDASKITRLLDNNPRKLSVKDIEVIYRRAYKGC
ncbi:iron-containing alcohol dehydrogenase [Halalkalibacter akibai]|uniref:Alcohol dehydrogenase n=1 Tax=Halalkalibacter akibai (strain ATCC 43226 / DSM 21942 / CIP 109018 / JCM 9157 / 1139) TaxID=1236973 RepID=W4QUL4_HALA3|nr:iron-containing alcohol dehydrogenase [Halalkalibacter akibai]GAE35860.1 alcohol dehydrogenase [Halalkalibacter akibai JCM 9157]